MEWIHRITLRVELITFFLCELLAQLHIHSVVAKEKRAWLGNWQKGDRQGATKKMVEFSNGRSEETL